MNLNMMIKYLVWVFLFVIALTGIYLLLRNLGVIA